MHTWSHTYLDRHALFFGYEVRLATCGSRHALYQIRAGLRTEPKSVEPGYETGKLISFIPVVGLF